MAKHISDDVARLELVANSDDEIVRSLSPSDRSTCRLDHGLDLTAGDWQATISIEKVMLKVDEQKGSLAVWIRDCPSRSLPTVHFFRTLQWLSLTDHSHS